MKEFEHIRYKIYLALLNKMSGTVGEEKKELIYHTVKEFEKKHPETKGISNFKILPDIQQCNTQDQYIFEK